MHPRGKVVRILPSSASLLENKTNESLISSRISKQMRSLLKKIDVASIHSSEPIIIKEDGCHVEEEEETSVVPVRRSNWDHVTIWSVDNTCVRLHSPLSRSAWWRPITRWCVRRRNHRSRSASTSLSLRSLRNRT